MKMKTININARGSYGSAKDKALTPNQRIDKLKELKDVKDRVIFILGCYGGLRVGEIQQLRKDWICRTNFDDKEVLSINIPNECRDIKNKYALWRPKTKNGRTTYIFDKELYLEIESYYNHNECINLSIRGLQERSYKRFDVNIHSLRATAQNYYKYELMLPAEVIAVFLGHKDIRTTMQHYNTLNKAQAESYLLQRFKDK